MNQRCFTLPLSGVLGHLSLLIPTKQGVITKLISKKKKNPQRKTKTNLESLHLITVNSQLSTVTGYNHVVIKIIIVAPILGFMKLQALINNGSVWTSAL